jgi:hypothetical protein
VLLEEAGQQLDGPLGIKETILLERNGRLVERWPLDGGGSPS